MQEKLFNTPENPNFIGAWYLSDPDICDELIEFYKNSDLKHPGETWVGVNKAVKDSTDIRIDRTIALTTPAIMHYMKGLEEVTRAYTEKYSYSLFNTPFSITELCNIQHYAPGGGYPVYHTERTPSTIARHLVWMTYLNDVTDGGETEFFYQKLKVKPEKGLTLIWPVDWMYTHRGNISPTQNKYIITGWYNF